MNWEKLFLRYIWNDQTVPYMVSVDKMNRRQGNSEILIYSLFLGVFFTIAALHGLRGGPEEASFGTAYYGFSVVCAAALFVILKSYYAALYLSAAPAVTLAHLYLGGIVSERETGDTVVVTGILLLLLWYSFRIVAVARAYPDMPDVKPDET